MNVVGCAFDLKQLRSIIGLTLSYREIAIIPVRWLRPGSGGRSVFVNLDLFIFPTLHLHRVPQWLMP